jgi:hypothetical protein
MIGDNIYLQDESGFGVYMYAGFNNSTVLLQIGANVTIGALTPTYYSGSPQLSNFRTANLSVNSTDNVVTPNIITYNDFSFNRIGTFVTLQNLTITYINPAKSSVTVKDSSNNTFTVRIDDATLLNADILGLKVGDVITVSGPLGYYDFDFDSSNHASYIYNKSKFQLMLTLATDVIIIE